MKLHFFFKYFLIYLLLIIILKFIYNNPSNHPIILYLVFPSKGKGGPSTLSLFIKNAVNNWNNDKRLSSMALIFHRESLEFNIVRNLTKSKNIFIWFEKSNYINQIKYSSYKQLFNKIIYGPIVTPINWFNSPKNNTYEQYWCEIMNRIKMYVTHSKRVSNHIIKFSNCKTNINKYTILKPCIESKEILTNINDYNNRSIDFLLYIKYADSNRKHDEYLLTQYLFRKYNIMIIKYGNYSRDYLFHVANRTKFVIYFSFYDTGALSLQEIKLMGVWPISHQKEFIERGFGTYISELDRNITASFSKLDLIYKIKFDPKVLSNNVKNNLNCVKSLYNVIKEIK